MELVELVPGHQLDQAADFCAGIELTGHIEMAAAVAKAWFVGDSAARGEDEGLRVEFCSAQDLA
ncbi:hypothetical protein D3C72_2447090 [compost metagenome]